MSGLDPRSRARWRPSPDAGREPFPRKGEVELRQTFGNDLIDLPPGNRHLLVVQHGPAPSGRSVTGPPREGVSFIAAIDGRQHLRFVPPDVTVFQFDDRFLLRACQVHALSYGAEQGSSVQKVLALADRTALLTLTGPPEGIALNCMWVALARGVGATFGGMPTRPDDAWLNPVALQRVVELVERRIDEDLSVATMASVAGLSTSAFLRAFRGVMGVTPGDYVLGRRIAVAADLLKTTTLPIMAVSRAAGFRSSNHFSTTFTARRGVSPSRFRRGREPAQ